MLSDLRSRGRRGGGGPRSGGRRVEGRPRSRGRRVEGGGWRGGPAPGLCNVLVCPHGTNQATADLTFHHVCKQKVKKQVCRKCSTNVITHTCKTLTLMLNVNLSCIEPTDNASVSFVKYKGDYYVSTETNFMHRVDPDSLESVEKVEANMTHII